MPPQDAARPFTGPIGQRLELGRDAARQLLLERGYGNPQVFGSIARGTDTDTSDIDLLIDLLAGVGLTQLARTAIDLETLLHAPVDLVPREHLRPRPAASIEDEAVPL